MNRTNDQAEEQWDGQADGHLDGAGPRDPAEGGSCFPPEFRDAVGRFCAEMAVFRLRLDRAGRGEGGFADRRVVP